MVRPAMFSSSIAYVCAATTPLSCLYPSRRLRLSSKPRLLNKNVSIVGKVQFYQAEEVVQYLRVASAALPPVMIHSEFIIRLGLVDLLFEGLDQV